MNNPSCKSHGGNLVHQSPEKARLYLFSPSPLIFEVIIHKNAEPGRNNSVICGGNEGGHM